MRFFATAAKGTEGALRDELKELRFRGIRAERGGVAFDGDRLEAARACLTSRIAIRMLVPLGDFDARDGEALYAGVRAIDFDRFIDPTRTLAVSSTSKNSALTHTQFIAQKTKDAVVDGFRERFGERPSVDLDDADLRLFVHLVSDHATLYADLSGEALHRRAYRTEQGAAPLKETLAAAVLRLGGWRPGTPLIDPTCGAGTLVLEAAMADENVAPGLFRDRFGFERWPSYDDEFRAATAALRAELRAAQTPTSTRLEGSDVDPAVIAIARENGRRAQVHATFVERALGDLRDVAPGTLIVMNPPYGERLERTDAMLSELGAMVNRLRGVRIVVLAGHAEIPRAIGRKPDKEHTLFNGPIECRLLTYQR